MILIFAQAISIFSQVLTILVLAHVILSYFMNPYHPVRVFIDRLVDPLLAPIRRVIPPFGMMDFSPLILLLLIQLVVGVLTSIV